MNYKLFRTPQVDTTREGDIEIVAIPSILPLLKEWWEEFSYENTGSLSGIGVFRVIDQTPDVALIDLNQSANLKLILPAIRAKAMLLDAEIRNEKPFEDGEELNQWLERLTLKYWYDGGQDRSDFNRFEEVHFAAIVAAAAEMLQKDILELEFSQAIPVFQLDGQVIKITGHPAVLEGLAKWWSNLPLQAPLKESPASIVVGSGNTAQAVVKAGAKTSTIVQIFMAKAMLLDTVVREGSRLVFNTQENLQAEMWRRATAYYELETDEMQKGVAHHAETILLEENRRKSTFA